MQRLGLVVLLVALLPVTAAASDGFAFTLGRGDENGDLEPVENTHLVRFTAIQDRYSGLSQGDVNWYGESFWEFDVGYWRWSDRAFQGSGELWEIAATPVFRLQRAMRTRAGLWPFVEAAIGAHFISDTTISSREMSTNFHFGSHLGLGTRFGPEKRYDLVLRLQHLSNAGIREPNPGINVYLVRLGYRFR
jgi:hypothetical protein